MITKLHDMKPLNGLIEDSSCIFIFIFPFLNNFSFLYSYINAIHKATSIFWNHFRSQPAFLFSLPTTPTKYHQPSINILLIIAPKRSQSNSIPQYPSKNTTKTDAQVVLIGEQPTGSPQPGQQLPQHDLQST